MYETTNRMAAKQQSGTCTAKGASKIRTNSKKIEWVIAEIAQLPPLRTFVAVRAMAPGAANPPNKN